MTMAGQPLRGLVAQGMDGRKASVAAAYVASFPPGSWTFTAPDAGFYKFVGWGPGGGVEGTACASGAYVEKTIRLARNQQVALVAGAAGAATTITDPLGNVTTAGAGISSAPGTASGGDVNLSGSAAGVAGSGTGGGSSSGTTPGGGAPAVLPYRGGAGGQGSGGSGASPGGGGAASFGPGGDSLIIVALVRF